MADVKLDIAFWNYDRTRALSDGSVRIKGVDAKYHSGSNVAEIFRGMVAEHRFDVSELGLTYFLRTFKEGESPFVAIPVFPVRAFRHSAIFVNANSGINKPEDLNGKTIGELALYSHDAGIVPKGMLMEEFGLKPETCRWLIGGLDWPLKPIDFVPHTHPANVKVADVPSGKDLGAMLDAGEIDALISADPPKCMLEHSREERPSRRISRRCCLSRAECEPSRPFASSRLGSGWIVVNPSFSRVRRSWSSLADCGLYYGHFATSFRMVFVPRIVNGTRSTFARGTFAKSDVFGFLRRHQ
jgi:hypothetical protein